MIIRKLCLILGIASFGMALAIPLWINPPCWECCCFPGSLVFSWSYSMPILFCLCIAAANFTVYFFWEDLTP